MPSSAAAEAEGRGGARARRAGKVRADLRVVELGLAPTREKAQALILAGEVLCDGSPVAKAGAALPAGALLELRPKRARFVGRGGEKLDGVLSALGVDAVGGTVWDIGASTGGFTDCLLRRGAARAVAVDVGRGQIDARLRADARVEVREGINARYLKPGDLPGPPSLIVVDVSFISLEKILPALAAAAPAAEIVTLVKPQFEVGRGQVGRGGVVRSAALMAAALERLCSHASDWGLAVLGVAESPLRGARGNREFFVRWIPASDPRARLPVDAAAAVAAAVGATDPP
jgi:23S rRNA (cytidine1920-2'-O)/16S rRNA (cytidine1409-2'-O)-methyltransferase